MDEHLHLAMNRQERTEFDVRHIPAATYLPADSATPERLAICDRLTDAYHRAVQDAGQSRSGDDIWDIHAQTSHAQLSDALRRRDRSAVLAILSNMFVDTVTTGLALGRGAYDLYKQHPTLLGLDWHDKAISLATALAVIPAQCPEQGEYGTAFDADSVALVREVARHLGTKLDPPQAGALFGVAVDGATYPINYLFHIYTAKRVVSLLAAAGEPLECVEIGGGVGFLAFAALTLGVQRFCVIDLPLVNVLQGYYLLNSALAGRVHLYGEGTPGAGDGIHLLPTTAIAKLPDRSVALVVNQDSMPEMDHSVATAYLRDIARISRRYFLSINQESRSRVETGFRHGWMRDLVAEVPALRLMTRAPYWLRKGYVEELYATGAPAPG